MTPKRQRLLLVAVMSGLLLAMLDQTIVGTALPRIVGALGGTSLYVWVVTAYLVPATVSLPPIPLDLTAAPSLGEERRAAERERWAEAREAIRR